MKRIEELAASIPVLVIFTVVFGAAALAAVFPGSAYIAERSVSVTNNFYVLGGIMALTIAGCVFQTLLVVRLIWGPAAVVGGDDVNIDIEHETNIRALKATNTKKFIIFVFFAVVNILAFDRVGRGVVVTDTKAYRVLTVLRSKDGQAFAESVQDAVILTGDKRITEALGREISEPGESREWAAYAAGARKDDALSDALLKLMKTGAPRERAAAAVALARIGDPRLVQAASEAFDGMGDLKGDLIKALGMLGKRPELTKDDLAAAGSFLAEKLDSGDLSKELARLTIWALGRFDAPEGLEPAEKFLGDFEDMATMCTALEALGHIGAAQTSPKLIEAIYKLNKNLTCPEIVYKDFTGHEVLVSSSINIIERLLHEIAHIGDRRAKPEMEKLAKDESFSKTVRNLAGEIAFQMKYLPTPTEPVQ